MTLSPGHRVRIRDEWPETRGPAHVRTPHYLRGRVGEVVRALGVFPNPEDLAFARPAETRQLYHVLVPAAELWPDAPHEIIVEIYEHWLEEAP